MHDNGSIASRYLLVFHHTQQRGGWLSLSVLLATRLFSLFIPTRPTNQLPINIPCLEGGNKQTNVFISNLAESHLIMNTTLAALLQRWYNSSKQSQRLSKNLNSLLTWLRLSWVGMTWGRSPSIPRSKSSSTNTTAVNQFFTVTLNLDPIELCVKWMRKYEDFCVFSVSLVVDRRSQVATTTFTTHEESSSAPNMEPGRWLSLLATGLTQRRRRVS